MLFFIFVRFAAALVQSTTFAVVFPFDEESSWYVSGRVPFIYQFFYLRKCKWLGIKDNASYDCRNAKLGFSSRLSFCRCRPITRVTSKIGLYQLTYHEMIVRTCDDKTRKSDNGQICLSYEEVTKEKLGVWKLKKLGIVNPVERRTIIIHLENIFSEEKFNVDTPFRNHFVVIRPFSTCLVKLNRNFGNKERRLISRLSKCFFLFFKLDQRVAQSDEWQSIRDLIPKMIRDEVFTSIYK